MTSGPCFAIEHNGRELTNRLPFPTSPIFSLFNSNASFCKRHQKPAPIT